MCMEIDFHQKGVNMKKSQLSLLLIGLLAIAGCSNSEPQPSSNGSHEESSSQVSSNENFEQPEITSSESSIDASTSSVNNEQTSSTNSESHSSSTRVAFDTPTNVKIEDDVLTWNAVTGATNGYRIRINSEQTKDVTSNSYEILSDTSLLTNGENTFEIRVNETEEHLISPYCQAVTYIHGANKQNATVFIEKVALIGNVSETSLTLINEAKSAYELLSDVDKLLEEVKDSYDFLCKKDGEYFALLVSKVTKADAMERETLINNAKDYYESLLDNSVDEVVNALKIVINSSVEHQIIYDQDAVGHLFIYAYGENILGDKLSEAAPEVKLNDVSVPLNGEDGFYYTNIQQDVEIFYGNEKVTDALYLEPVDGRAVGVDDNFGFIGDDVLALRDHWRATIYRNDDVAFENGQVMLYGMPLASFKTGQPIDQKALYRALGEAGYTNQTIEYRLMIELVTADGRTSKVTNEAFSGTKSITIEELKLSSPLEIDSTQPNIKDNGDLDYRWELINANQEWKNGDVAYLEIRLYDAELEFVGEETETLAIMEVVESGFIYKNDILTVLKDHNVKGAHEIKMAMRFVASEDSLYASSDFVILDGSYTYEVDYHLNNYGNISVDSETGRLIWPWEIFMDGVNPEATFVDHMEVYIFSGDETEATEEKALGSFIVDYRSGTQFTYKEDIEKVLKDLGLSSGSYRFSVKLIAVENSDREDSYFYPMTDSFAYTVAEE